MDTSVNDELIKLYEQIGRLQDEIANLTKEVYQMSVVHYDEVDGTPENLSEFNNDMNYASMGEVDEKIKSIPPTDDSNYLKKSGEEEQKCDIPTIFKYLYTVTQKKEDNSDNVATTKFVHQLVKESSKATEQHLSGVYQKYKPLTLAQVKGEIDNALVIYDTASIINEKIAAAIRGISIPSRTSELQNDSGYITIEDVPSSPVLSVNGQTGEVTIQIPTVPTNISAFTNDVGYITDAGVTSVNNQTGSVYVQENVQSDWSAVNGNSAILNKPALKRVATTGSYNDLDDTPNLATVAMSGDYNDLSNRIVAAQLVGRLHRTNVSGSGNINVTGTSGQFPTITTPGTYTLHTYMKSETQSYSLYVTFGTASYTLTTTNGEINDVREYTISGRTTWSASIPSGSVAANTELDVKIIKASAEYVSTIGYAAISNDYNDLDNTPVIPTKTSQLTNDSGFLTQHQSLDAYATKQQLDTLIGTEDATTIIDTFNEVVDFLDGVTNDETLTGKLYEMQQDIDNKANASSIPTNTSDLTNDSGFITSSSLTNYVTTNTAQDISGRKTFLGDKAIYFKQSTASNKLGFTLYNNGGTEIGAFEYHPTGFNNTPLLNINTRSTNTVNVGFRYHSGTVTNIVAPRAGGNYYIPVIISNGTNTATANNAGTVNISSLLPDVSNFITGSDLTTTLIDYATTQQVGGKEDKVEVITYASDTTIESGKCYKINASSSNVSITLPTVSGNYLENVILYVTTGASTTLTINAPSGVTFLYADGFGTIDNNTQYEINCLWNGANWVLAKIELGATA